MCIVEIEDIEGIIVPRERPTVALCDVASTTSWVSSKFVDELEATGFSLTSQKSRRKEGRPPRIQIRWSCDTLGQAHEEGTFFIEPKAQFKISFGCAYSINHLPPKSHHPRPSTRRKGKQSEQESHIRDEAVESFRQGIQAGVILPLERMTAVTDDQQPLMQIANVEAELHHTWQSYSSTDQALSNSNDAETSSYCLSSSYGEVSAGDIVSTRGSETDSDNRHIAQSANTSVSGSSYQSSSWADQPALGGWMSQTLYEEPQPWVIPRIIQSERRPHPFQRCRNLTPRGQAKLAAARAISEREAAEYWQWDDEAQKYKHYDEGCSEPVWYNPP